MKYRTLNDVIPDWLTDSGIMSALGSLDVPWKDENIDTELDLEYHGNISGEKIISPLVRKLLDDNGILSTVNINKLANIIYTIYGLNWSKLWETLSFEYNPIENYSMTEQLRDDEKTYTHGKSSTQTNNLTHAKTGTVTDEIDDSTTVTPNTDLESSTDIYGFNSSTAVPSDVKHDVNTGTVETERDAENVTRYNTSDTDTGTQTIVNSGSDTETHEYDLTRKGNIGVTTSQQMIESERNLWIWNFFRNTVFPDIDTILTLKIY